MTKELNQYLCNRCIDKCPKIRSIEHVKYHRKSLLNLPFIRRESEVNITKTTIKPIKPKQSWMS